MILHRFYDDLLAQASYLVGCEATRQALVIDPNRDVQPYLDAAARERLSIVCVTETHIHADFVSGARDLAHAAGAALALPAEGGPGWEYPELAGRAAGGARAPSTHDIVATPGTVIPLRDGDALRIGALRFDVMHTPGHTPEHVVFLATDTAASEVPLGMFSGDFIFVGDVGRPDLLEKAAHIAGTMERSARELYASLRRSAALPDYLQLWPGHGAGSACGKALGAMPQSTLGYERIVNSALRHASEAAFVADILSAQPEPPRYFARMKRVNRDGLRAVPAGRIVPRMSPDDARRAIREGMLVIDARPSAEFVGRFLPGTICVPKSKSFLSYFGAVAPEDAPVVLLVAVPDDAAVITRWLHLIGFDDVRGWALAADVIASAAAAGETLASMRTTTVHDANGRLGGNGGAPTLVDVRTAAERQLGTIPGSLGVALSALDEWARRAPTDTPLVLHCQGGSRAVIGASLLLARGFRNVSSMTGGFAEWSSVGLPVDRDS